MLFSSCVTFCFWGNAVCQCYGRSMGHMPLLQPKRWGASAWDWPQLSHFFYFGQLFNTSCSPLTKILICSSLFPLRLLSGVVLPWCLLIRLNILPPHCLAARFEWPEFLKCNFDSLFGSICFYFVSKITKHSLEIKVQFNRVEKIVWRSYTGVD